MTAATGDRGTHASLGELLAIPVGAGETIYAGCMVCVDLTGYAVPGADTGNFKFAGVAEAQADNSDGADGDIEVVVRRRGRFLFTYDGYTGPGSLMSLVYISDDSTVDDAAGLSSDILAGILVKREASASVWVEIDCATKVGFGWVEPSTTTAGG